MEAYLDRALALSIDIGDPITRVSERTESKACTWPKLGYHTRWGGSCLHRVLLQLDRKERRKEERRFSAIAPHVS